MGLREEEEGRNRAWPRPLAPPKEQVCWGEGAGGQGNEEFYCGGEENSTIVLKETRRRQQVGRGRRRRNRWKRGDVWVVL